MEFKRSRPDLNHNNKTVEIQQQTSTGLWQTIRIVDHINMQYIRRQMQFIKSTYPKSSIRAVTSDGQLVDMLP